MARTAPKRRWPARSIATIQPCFSHVVRCLNDSPRLLRSLSSYLLLLILGRVALDTLYPGISTQRLSRVFVPVEVPTDEVSDER